MVLYSKEDYKKANKKSIHNRSVIKQSDMVGCYYCLQVYKASLIKEFIDKDDDTALCAHCGIDSILGDADGLPEENRDLFLKYIRWYGFCHLHCPDGTIKIVEEIPKS